MFHKHTRMHSNVPTIFFFSSLIYFNALQLSCEIQPAGFSHLTINLILIALCSFRHHACIKSGNSWLNNLTKLDITQLLNALFSMRRTSFLLNYCPFDTIVSFFCTVVWRCLLRPNKLYLFSRPACSPSPDSFLPLFSLWLYILDMATSCDPNSCPLPHHHHPSR